MASPDHTYMVEAEEAAPAGGEARARAAADSVDDINSATTNQGESAAESSSPPVRQLIYTGKVVLASYDVAGGQQQAIDLSEELGGYVSHRSSDHLVLRVPAAEFRTALDSIADLGDVLEMSWEAEDVTEEMRDLEIRLGNAIELRNRLQQLLERADTVEDALKIESELERVTLQIERIRGQLENMEDRIAYSTIHLHFDPKQVDEVPDDDFLLPVAWVDDLGLQSLLEAPKGWR